MQDYSTATVRDLVLALRERRVSALELFDEAVGRIERLDGTINAVVVKDFDRARDAARQADALLARGERRPLLGVPMTVKESFDVAGLPTSWGLPSLKEMIASADAVAVTRLKAAGAVILGKTNVAVGLGDWQSTNPVYGRTCNPLDPRCSPGGSSGGSAAALAAGYVPLEFGSDIGGSIRIPAAFCGVFGHKPSYDIIPLRGHAPGGSAGAPPPMAVVGPLARNTADLELALDITAGPDDEAAVAYALTLPEPRHERLADFRVLVVSEHPGGETDDEIRNALAGVGERLRRTGCRVDEQTSALPDLANTYRSYLAMLTAITTRRTPSAREPISSHAWMDALDAQHLARHRWVDVFRRWDVVLAPCFGTVAFPHVDEPEWHQRRLTINGAQVPYRNQIAWPSMASFAHLPATAIPVASAASGLPIGIQIIGPYLEDRTTLAFARHVERELGGWSGSR